MGAVLAGTNKVIRISDEFDTAADSYTCIEGINSASLTRGGETIDVTTFCNNDEFVRYIKGLKNFEISLSGFRVPATGGAQEILDKADFGDLAIGTNTSEDPAGRNHVYVQYLIKDAGATTYSGFAAKMIVENFNQDGSPADAETLEVALKLAEPNSEDSTGVGYTNWRGEPYRLTNLTLA